MKKRFAAPLAAVLAMSMAFSSLAAVKLDTPVVRWSSEREALPEWTRVENASNEYQVEAFWDGKSMWDSRHTFSSTDTREWLKSSGFVNKLKDSGTYTFRVMALGDGNDTLNSDWSELSAPWTFEKSSVSLGSPVNLRWDGTTACWDAPEIPAEYASYFKGYEVYLLADGQSWSGYSNVQNTSQDLADNMTKEGAKEYSFSVRAVSNTPSKIFHSETVYADDPYKPGDASDKEKFLKWAEVLGKAIGNPLFHWSHLELQKYFGYHGVLNKNTAEEVWELCNKRLAEPDMTVRNIIKQSNVTLICTTDDPIDSLEWHKKIAEDASFDVKVLPAWRPDKAMNIEKPTYPEYLDQLSAVSGIKVATFADLCKALSNRMDFFASMGCCVSDHALEYVMYAPASAEEIESIFAKRLAGNDVTKEEELKFKTAFMVNVGKEYAKRNWVMQLHYGCKRDNNTPMFNKLGPDTGYDCINNYAPSSEMADFLNALNQSDELPKTIIYSLNPNDNQAIGTILGCFQDSTAVAKIQQGSAWWFNDHKTGMQDQMISLANLGNLSGFVGMLTDSRSFLSYTRHDYFRRILCNLIGNWVENGEFPADYETLEEIVKGICYNNAVNYFGFDLKTC